MKNLKLTLALLVLVGLSGLTTSCESEDNTAELYELDIQKDVDAGNDESEVDGPDSDNGGV